MHLQIIANRFFQQSRRWFWCRKIRRKNRIYFHIGVIRFYPPNFYERESIKQKPKKL